MPPVGIGLRHRSGRDLERFVRAVADDLHVYGMQTGVCAVDGSECIFRTAGLDRHGDFNVPQGIRAHGEDLVRIVQIIGGSGASGIIHDHHVFIDRTPALDRDRTSSVACAFAEITVGVKITAAFDRYVGILLQYELSVGADLSLAVIQRLGADTQRSSGFHGDTVAGRKDQFPVQRARRRIAVGFVDMAFHIIFDHGRRSVIRHKKRDAVRNGKTSLSGGSEDFAVLLDDDRAGGSCRGDRLIKIIVFRRSVAPDVVDRGAGGNELRRDGTVSGTHRIRVCAADDRPVSVDPCREVIARVRDSRQLIILVAERLVGLSGNDLPAVAAAAAVGAVRCL